MGWSARPQLWARVRVAHVRLCFWCGLGALAGAKESRGRIAFQMASTLPLSLLVSARSLIRLIQTWLRELRGKGLQPFPLQVDKCHRVHDSCEMAKRKQNSNEETPITKISFTVG